MSTHPDKHSNSREITLSINNSADYAFSHSLDGRYINEEQNDAAAYVSGIVYATMSGTNNKNAAGVSQSTASAWTAVSLALVAMAAML